MVPKVKICGITNIDDARAAVNFGADALGFVFFPESPRNITVEHAGEIIRALPPFVTTVGVFVNRQPDELRSIIQETGLDAAQLHGTEPPDICGQLSGRVIKGIRVKELSDLDPLEHYCVSAYLLDTYSPDSFGGTGRIFNWDIAVEAKRYGPIILAGGLTPDNIQDAVEHVRPYAVDVSSGVEAEKGRKDHEKMRLFIHRAKSTAEVA